MNRYQHHDGLGIVNDFRVQRLYFSSFYCLTAVKQGRHTVKVNAEKFWLCPVKELDRVSNGLLEKKNKKKGTSFRSSQLSNFVLGICLSTYCMSYT